MKTLDSVEYNEELLSKVKSAPIIKENYINLVKDFEKLYKDVLLQELPDEIPDSHLSKTKTDLLCAYLWGSYNACYTQSLFRRNFNLPKEQMEAIIKPKKPSIIV